MPRLLLLRHAKAEQEDSGGPGDFERKLTSRGETAATLIGRYMSLNRIMPDRVLCSPSVRTRATLDLVLAELGTKLDVIMASAIYNATTEALIGQIREHGGNADTLLVVGHNTGIEEALALLVRPGANSLALPSAYPTGALAIVGTDSADWSELEEKTGRLLAFVRPRDLEGKPRSKD